MTSNGKLYPLINIPRTMYEITQKMQRIGDERLASSHIACIIRVKSIPAWIIRKLIYNVMELHPSLKAKIVLFEGKPYYMSRDDWKPEIKEFILEEENIINGEPDPDFFRKKYGNFNIPGDDMIKIAIYKYGKYKYLFIDIHHLVTDGMSSIILLKDMQMAYGGKKLLKEKMTFFDCINDMVEKLNDKSEQEFFLNYLGGRKLLSYPSEEEPLFELPVYHTVKETISLTNIKTRCKAHGSTVENAFLCASLIALSRCSGNESFFLLKLISGRKKLAYTRTVGCFIEFLPITYDASECTYGEELSKLDKKIDEIQSHDFILDAYPNIRFETAVRFNFLAKYDFDSFAAETEKNNDINLKMYGPSEYDYANTPAIIEILGCEEDEYMVTISYNRQMYKEKTMKMVVERICAIMKEEWL